MQPQLFPEYEEHHVKAVSAPFFELTNHIYDRIPSGLLQEKAIQLVLDARDCALRAAVESPTWVKAHKVKP